MPDQPEHIPVLRKEVIEALAPHPGGIYVDGTLGAGGHTRAILEASAPNGVAIGFDRDPEAIERARRNLIDYPARLIDIHNSYDQMQLCLQVRGYQQVDGILLDLGYSSPQIDDPARGFSFRDDGPLDMRYDTTRGSTAADLVNTLPEDTLADIIYRYGEDRYSRRIAAALVEARPLHTTNQLADVVRRALPRSSEKIDPATRTFQALRIAVNDELGALSQTLPQAVRLLKPGGRLAVISFHSLEDRIVKQFFKEKAADWEQIPTHPMGGIERTPTLKILTKKPITASDEELRANPRARSAKLRVAERV